MNEIALLRRLHEHRTWVNHQLLDAAATLSEEALRQPCAIGQGSIWKTLLHLYAAEYVWLQTLRGDEAPLVLGDLPGKLPGNQQAAGASESLAELRRLWSELDGHWQVYLHDLTVEQLEGIIHKVASTSGRRQATRADDVLLHVCLHAHYTTAQAINMLRQVGLRQLPDVMLISLARQQMANP